MENTNTNSTPVDDRKDQTAGDVNNMAQSQPLEQNLSGENAAEVVTEPEQNQPVIVSEQGSPIGNTIEAQPEAPVEVQASNVQPMMYATTQATATAQAPAPPMPQAQQEFQTVQPLPANESGSHGAVMFILQWVTYALWGWTLLVLSWVIFALVLSMLNESDMGEFILYPISALVILLPASIVADSIYGRKEPRVKKGGALAIMVIHVVIYVLFMIGFLISAMFSIVNMAVSSNDSNDALGYFISSLLVSACYALLITRTLRPQTFRKINEEN